MGCHCAMLICWSGRGRGRGMFHTGVKFASWRTLICARARGHGWVCEIRVHEWQNMRVCAYRWIDASESTRVSFDGWSLERMLSS